MSARAPRLVAVAGALPPHAVPQARVRELIAALFAGHEAGSARLLAVFEHSGIEQRHFVMPIEWYAAPRTFAEQNARFVEAATALGAEAARSALARAGIGPDRVDHIVAVCTTGLATPSLDARIALELGVRGDCRRTPVWGLGCAGGAAGLALSRDLAAARPAATVLVVAVELCSLTFRREDLDKRNLVAASLFADGAAAAVVRGPEAAPAAGTMRAVELLASHSTLWPGTLGVMGWDVSERGLHVVFSRDIPSLVRQRVRPGLETFLAEQGLALDDVRHLAAHPGGAKVIAAYAETLGRPVSAFGHALEVLRGCGNMSSPTCLFVLERMLAAGEVGAGEPVLVAALGPGFAAEYVLGRGAA